MMSWRGTSRIFPAQASIKKDTQMFSWTGHFRVRIKVLRLEGGSVAFSLVMANSDSLLRGGGMTLPLV